MIFLLQITIAQIYSEQFFKKLLPFKMVMSSTHVSFSLSILWPDKAKLIT